ncbi:hypothetical protein P154DRAFT_542224 [Amniculicola lignicola CBS 123094]|uniref:Uncharacterized protein n=1 Tax=Amniculicola lignicola CBS 123094 TaxID=1392246 RepID=A0A6A5WZ72_9PLEO|nr:hypothetical protein P154DRAFT_542224 [Amniculicola lignicola CBS 123094]
MAIQPRRIVQTTAEAKREYKKNGSRLSERQQRQLERDAELDQRATRVREQEKRRKAAKQKREEQERRERESRQRNGVGLATQMAGYNHTQAAMKKGMETFLGYKKGTEAEDKKKEDEIRESLRMIAEDLEKEPWDDDDDIADLPSALDIPAIGDHWIDSDVDDDTLLEAHDLVMSDSIEEATAVLPPPQLPAPSAPSPALLRHTAAKDDPNFLRLHGPIDKAIEPTLKRLPGPLLELLSQDASLDTSRWDPAHALLHKLNPRGLPPHRLRLKVGCVVIPLQTKDTNSKPAKTTHLQVLQVDKDSLHCLVLDGYDAGTKINLKRVELSSKYKNQENCLFRRLQFPVRVSINYRPPKPQADTSRAVPVISTTSRQSTENAKPNGVLEPAPNTAKKSTESPAFKRPSLPASKSDSFPTAPKPDVAPLSVTLDGWDDFLDSASQIARDINSECTAAKGTSRPFAKKAISPKKSPGKLPWLNKTKGKPATSRPPPPALKRKASAQPLELPQSKRPAVQRRANLVFSRIPAVHTSSKGILSKIPTKKSTSSLWEFGFSTQDITSLLDEDESTIFSSPPIPV